MYNIMSLVFVYAQRNEPQLALFGAEIFVLSPKPYNILREEENGNRMFTFVYAQRNEPEY